METERFSKLIHAHVVGWLVLASAIFLFLRPPLNFRDAREHLFRAYQVSTGEFVPEQLSTETKAQTKKQLGGHIPVEYVETAAGFRLIYETDTELVPQTVWQLVTLAPNQPVSAERQKLQYENFANTAIYSPLNYLPQSVGMIVARHFKLSAMQSIYAGVSCLLLTYLLGVVIIFRLLPNLGALIITIATLPQLLGQAASLSADGVSNLGVLLFVSYVLSLRERVYTSTANRITARSIVALYCGALLLGFLKPSIAFAALTVILLPPRAFRSGLACFAIWSSVPLLALGGATLWQYAIDPTALYDYFHSTIDPVAQWQLVTADPQGYFGTVWRSFSTQLWIFRELVDGFSVFESATYNVVIAKPLSIAAMISLATLTVFFYHRARLNFSERLTLVSLGFAYLMIVYLIIYLTYTPLGATFIPGVQGRYLLFVCLMVLLSVSAAMPTSNAVTTILTGLTLFLFAGVSGTYLAQIWDSSGRAPVLPASSVNAVPIEMSHPATGNIDGIAYFYGTRTLILRGWSAVRPISTTAASVFEAGRSELQLKLAQPNGSPLVYRLPLRAQQRLDLLSLPGGGAVNAGFIGAFSLAALPLGRYEVEILTFGQTSEGVLRGNRSVTIQ